MAKFNRDREVKQTQRWLMRLHSPRLHMSLIIALTGGVGFLSSFVLLHFGMGAMWLRYSVAAACAYVSFLFFLWCWMRWRSDDFSGPDGSYADPPRGGVDCGPGHRASNASDVELPDIGGGLDGGDELVLVLIAIAVLFSFVWVAIWIVWAAPALFAEILVDAALAGVAGGLYRVLPGLEVELWLRTAIQRTVWQFLLTAVLLGMTGAVIQHFVPSAKSIGQVYSGKR